MISGNHKRSHYFDFITTNPIPNWHSNTYSNQDLGSIEELIHIAKTGWAFNEHWFLMCRPSVVSSFFRADWAFNEHWYLICTDPLLGVQSSFFRARLLGASPDNQAREDFHISLHEVLNLSFLKAFLWEDLACRKLLGFKCVLGVRAMGATLQLSHELHRNTSAATFVLLRIQLTEINANGTKVHGSTHMDTRYRAVCTLHTMPCVHCTLCS